MLVAIIIAVSFLFVPRWVRDHASQARWEATEDAQVTGDLRPLAPHVGGYVASVPVEDYQAVQAGQPVAVIEQSDYRARLQLADAQLEERRRTLAVLDAQAASQASTAAAARAQLPGDAAMLRFDQAQLVRTSQLAPTGAAAQSAYDQAFATERNQAAILRHDQETAVAAERQVAVSHAQRRVAEAQVTQAQAQRDLEALNLGWTVVRAPGAGVLDKRLVFPGQLVQPGAPITHLVPLDTVWVQANFRETQLARVLPGQHAEVRVDAYPGVVLGGYVARLAEGTGSATAMLPSENATGNFTKVVQRLPIKIVLVNQGGLLRGRLPPGLNVEVRIDTLSGPGPAPTGRLVR